MNTLLRCELRDREEPEVLVEAEMDCELGTPDMIRACVYC